MPANFRTIIRSMVGSKILGNYSDVCQQLHSEQSLGLCAAAFSKTPIDLWLVRDRVLVRTWFDLAKLLYTPEPNSTFRADQVVDLVNRDAAVEAVIGCFAILDIKGNHSAAARFLRQQAEFEIASDRQQHPVHRASTACARWWPHLFRAGERGTDKMPFHVGSPIRMWPPPTARNG